MFYAGPPDLSTVCTDLALLTGLCASVMSLMTALVALIDTFIIAFVMFCLAAIFAMIFSRPSFVSLPVSSISWSAFCDTS